MARQVGVQDEFEVTPEMIRAGVVCLYGYDDQADSAKERVVEIFLEMIAARDQGQRQSCLPVLKPSRLNELYQGNPSLHTELIVEKLHA